MLETTSSEWNVAIGKFLPETPVDQRNNKQSSEGLLSEEQLVVTSSTSDSDNVQYSEQNDCERNIVYHKFDLNDDRVSFNWTTSDLTALTTESNSINFR